ncbi:MAG: phosphoribosyl-ATP pyrophosphohydrolase/phosphoribosyl-AMP cyclohydrolase [Cyclobacteriaceae bacterium]|jgi:phosphoribosyl-ATP pyrophosphohydrolase/phosphoribosyl-AMP cyclohydrolase
MKAIDFEKGDGLVPAIVQDAYTKKVLMLGYMNKESFELTESTKKVTFWSRSKDRLWVKGESSGNTLHYVSAALDCDQDSLLIQANPAGPTCHTGDDTCFQETNEPNGVQFLSYLFSIISDRYEDREEGSYTSSLFNKGMNKVAQKVGEEAVEVVIEAKDDNIDLFKNESADLIYHLLVLIRAKEIQLDDVIDVLKMRHKPS